MALIQSKGINLIYSTRRVSTTAFIRLKSQHVKVFWSKKIKVLEYDSKHRLMLNMLNGDKPLC